MVARPAISEGSAPATKSDLFRTIMASSPTTDRVFASRLPAVVASKTANTRSAASARALARRTPSASIAPPPSRRPAVSAITTGTPPRSRWASTTSRVVPAMGLTIATLRFANILIILDFPTFGGPTTATNKPLRRRSPRRPSSRCAAISCATSATTGAALNRRSSGSASSAKSNTASTWAKALIRRTRQSP